MTLAVAFVRGDAAFVIADTALTRPGEPSHPISTFGESTRVEDKRVVEEAVAKIHRIGDSAVAACVGHITPAYTFIKVLRELKAAYPTALLPTLLSDAVDSQETTKGAKFQLVIAWWDGLRARVTVFDSHLPSNLEQNHQLVAAGSGIGQLGDILPRLVAPPEFTKNASLAVALARLQIEGVHQALFEIGVGGAFYGAYVDSRGVTWNDDLAYALYDPAILSDDRLINDIVEIEKWEPAAPPSGRMEGATCRVRDDVLVLHSTFAPTHLKCLGGTVSEAAWKAKWDSSLYRLAGEMRARYFVWLNRLEKVAVVIEMPEVEGEKWLMRLVRREGRAHFVLRTNVIDRMKASSGLGRSATIHFFAEPDVATSPAGQAPIVDSSTGL